MKNILSTFLLLSCFNLIAQIQPLGFTAVMDINVPASAISGKAVMLTTNEEIGDLSQFSIKQYLDGSTDASETFNLPPISSGAYQNILLCRDSAGLSNYFDGCLEQLIGSPHPTIFVQGGFPNINGNDALELINNSGSYISSEPVIFVEGANENWPYVFVAAQLEDGNEGSEQTFSINITELPAGGANYRVAKTVANGNYYFGNAEPLNIGLNEKTVNSVDFDRTVKFQFSTGDIKFDAVTLNGNNIFNNSIEVYGVIGEDPDTYGAGCNSLDCWDTERSWAWKDNTSENNETWVYAEVNCSNGSVYTQSSDCPFPLAVNSCSTSEPCDSVVLVLDTITTTIYDTNIVTIYDTNIVVLIDSSFVTFFDTVTTNIYDTINIHDTILYIDLSLSFPSISNSSIIIYPNPTYDYVIIENEFYNLTSEFIIEITNISGEEVYYSNFLSDPIIEISIIDIGQAGIYLIKIRDANDNIVANKKLVIVN